MTERLLQFIWQFQYYNKSELSSTDGDALEILNPGHYNNHQGPDFLEGRIRIGENIWVGSIELHINSSDWYNHAHTGDLHYKNVILHVVWNYDDQFNKHDFPTLVLSDRVPKLLLGQYDIWMKGDFFIACAASASLADELVWRSWKERLLIERVERKSEQVLSMLAINNYHWEEAAWRILAKNFGLYVNSDAFAAIAASIPFNIISKHRSQVIQIEALLFGQAGLLDLEFVEKYPLMLKKEYNFLQRKYALHKENIPIKFLRMRPACFPTVRLAQLAMLMHSTENMMSYVLDTTSLKKVREKFDVTANDYWHYHFRFEECSPFMPKKLGDEMVSNIIINSLAPLLFAYGRYHHEHRYKLKAADWLLQLPPEDNSVIKQFRKIGIGAKSGADGQALIELKSKYCDSKRCLDCAVGNAVLKRQLIVKQAASSQ